MEYRTLGETNLRCSVLGLGTGRLTSASTGLSRKHALRLIHTAADYGINFIDTADSYGQGDSEIVVGEAIHGNRANFLVASKVGYRFARLGKLMVIAKPLLKPVLRRVRRARSLVGRFRENARATNMLQQDFSPEYLELAVNGSLRRLRTDYLDLLYLHDVPLAAAQTAVVFETLNRIHEAGKVRHFGFSASDPAVLELALKQPRIVVVQTAVHPWRPAPLWPTLSKLVGGRIGVVANDIFGGALLRCDEESSPHQRLLEVARRYEMSPRQVLIGFAARRPSVCSVLTGTISCEHLKENIADVLSARRISGEELVS